MTTPQKTTIAVLLALGLLGATWSALGRMAVERANRTVGLCVDDLEVRQLAALTGQQPETLLQQLKQAGATHVAVSERSLGELLQSGEVRVNAGKPFPGLIGAPEVMVPLSQRLYAAHLAFDGQQCKVGSEVLLYTPPAVATMLKMGVLYDPAAVKMVHQVGLEVLARPAPDFIVTPEAVMASLQAARATGSRIVLYNGVAVAGGVQLAKQTAAALAAAGLEFGYVELVPQEGATNLASALKYQIIRTHSISQDEMIKTPASRGVDRFTLAVNERNIRMCYLRLMLNPQPDIVQANVAYLRTIHDGLQGGGFTFGEPIPFQPLEVPRKALLLIALGVVGGALWLTIELLRPPDRWVWGLGACGAVIAVGGSVAARSVIEAVFPLLAGVVFPTLAVLVAASLGGSDAANVPERPRPSLLKALGLVVVAAAITVLGGLFIAGMLSSSGYMMQIAQFKEVKVAELLPMLLVFAVMLARTYAPHDGSGSKWPSLRQGFTAVAGAFVTYWHAVAVFLVLGVVAFMILRSGNDSGVEVSGTELKLRAVLDHLLVVRPRTKEILFGFPALLMGLTLLLQGRPRTVWLWLTFGVIGLISTTNTCCHIHTPLPVSLLRIFNGIWVGLLVGVLWLVAKAILDRLARRWWWTDQTS